MHSLVQIACGKAVNLLYTNGGVLRNVSHRTCEFFHIDERLFFTFALIAHHLHTYFPYIYTHFVEKFYRSKSHLFTQSTCSTTYNYKFYKNLLWGDVGLSNFANSLNNRWVARSGF